MRKKLMLAASAIVLLGAPLTFVHAEDKAPSSVEAQKDANFKAASEAANKVLIRGPHDIPVAGQATLHLPQGYFFVPQPQAGQYAQALGNPASPRLAGIVGAPTADWLAYIDYINDGHVNDDDAKTWNPNDMLQSLREGTEAGNSERVSRGFPPLEVASWIEVPAYDASSHHLVWSALVKDKTDPNATASANYNTYALGRDGHFEFDLVADADKVEGYKANAKQLLGALEFDKGHRYNDFNANTDRLAAYGLAALVGGVAAKKLGLIALVGAFIVKFAKLIGLAVLGLLASIRRLFRRESSPSKTGEGRVS